MPKLTAVVCVMSRCSFRPVDKRNVVPFNIRSAVPVVNLGGWGDDREIGDARSPPAWIYDYDVEAEPELTRPTSGLNAGRLELRSRPAKAAMTAASTGTTPQTSMPVRAPKWLVTAPMIGAPMGVPPTKTSM
jgi:hypothetical protein